MLGTNRTGILDRAPKVVRNSAQATKDNIVVYVCSAKGEIELAPDNRLTQSQLDRVGYKGWKRCEANGAKEIEKLAIAISRQAFERKKQMKVEQHIRECHVLDRLKANARIKIAQHYSELDVDVARSTLRRAESAENKLFTIIAEEFDPQGRTVGLAVERSEQSTSPLAHVGGKTQGLV